MTGNFERFLLPAGEIDEVDAFELVARAAFVGNYTVCRHGENIWVHLRSFRRGLDKNTICRLSFADILEDLEWHECIDGLGGVEGIFIASDALGFELKNLRWEYSDRISNPYEYLKW